MPVEGMTKKANCKDCGKRITFVYKSGKWKPLNIHTDKSGNVCSRAVE